MTTVFVYGTLKTGGANDRFLRGQRKLGPGRTRPEFRLFELEGYPGMVPAGSGGRSIEGELWQVDDACLARLDELEGVRFGLYARRAILLPPPRDGMAVETYIYLGNVDGRRELGTGYALIPPLCPN